MHRFRILPLLYFLLLAVLPALAYTLKQEGDRTYLMHDGHRLLVREGDVIVLGYPSALDVRLTDGTTLSLPNTIIPRYAGEQPTIIAKRSGKIVAQVKAEEKLNEWLQDDLRWGGHEDGNQMRYMAKDGGGVAARFSCPVVQGQSALAVMSWHFLGPSFMPLAREFIVRVRAQPRLTVEPVRLLETVESEFWGSQFATRLFHTKAGDLFFRNRVISEPTQPNERRTLQGELVRLSAEGKAVKVVCTLPGHLVPDGIIAWRWIVLVSSREKDPEPIWLYDTVKHTLKPLPGNWGDYPVIRYTVNGTRVLIRKSYERSNGAITLISVVTGNRAMHSIPDGEERHTEWRDAVVVLNDTTVVVYDAGWHRLARLELPATSL